MGAYSVKSLFIQQFFFIIDSRLSILKINRKWKNHLGSAALRAKKYLLVPNQERQKKRNFLNLHNIVFVVFYVC